MPKVSIIILFTIYSAIIKVCGNNLSSPSSIPNATKKIMTKTHLHKTIETVQENGNRISLFFKDALIGSVRGRYYLLISYYDFSDDNVSQEVP